MNKKIIVLFSIYFFTASFAYAGTIKGTVSTQKIKTPQDTLVYIEKIDGKDFTPPQGNSVMDQKNIKFIPKVLPLLQGATVEFHNSDDLKHNVFAVGDYNFNLGTWGKDAKKNYIFDKSGEAAILCNVHPEMEAYIVVLQNPYFAVADEQGRYEIKDVPAGNFILKTWHWKLKPVSKEALVSEGGELVVDFFLQK